MFVLGLFLVVITALSLYACKKYLTKKVDLDSLSKSEIIDLCNTIKYKKTDFTEYKDKLSSVNVKSLKLLPFCLELIQKINQTLPHFIVSSLKKRFHKNRKSQITIEEMEQSMDSDQVNFEDGFYPNIKLINCPSGAITIDEFNMSYKKNVCNKFDFMKLSKKHLYNIPDYLKFRLINIFNEMIWGNDTDKVSEHAVGVSYLIYKETKKGPLNEKSSYRTITSVPVAVNYFHRILAMRLVNYFVEDNKVIDTNIHKGSIPDIKYPVLEQILKVKNIVRIGNNPHLMMIDISNAFPSLNIKKTFSLLRNYGVDEKVLNYLDSFYESLEYKTFVNRHQSTRLKPWKQGLLQGCPLSPIIFVILMNYITNILSEKYLTKYGVDFKGIPILFTAYLDDICIITNSSEGLQVVFNEMKSMLEEFNLQINMSKTKTLSTEKALPEIECVENLVYLGEIIELDLTLKSAYKNVFRTLIKKLYRTDKHTYDNEKKFEVFFEYTLPFLQRKLIVYYDFSLEQKTNLRKMVYHFLTKWGYKGEVAMQNPLSQTMKDSTDPYIALMLTDDFTTSCDKHTSQLEGGSKKALYHKFHY